MARVNEGSHSFTCHPFSPGSGMIKHTVTSLTKYAACGIGVTLHSASHSTELIRCIVYCEMAHVEEPYK